MLHAAGSTLSFDVLLVVMSCAGDEDCFGRPAQAAVHYDSRRRSFGLWRSCQVSVDDKNDGSTHTYTHTSLTGILSGEPFPYMLFNTIPQTGERMAVMAEEWS